jgi:hypothetical protein
VFVLQNADQPHKRRQLDKSTNPNTETLSFYLESAGISNFIFLKRWWLDEVQEAIVDDSCCSSSCIEIAWDCSSEPCDDGPLQPIAATSDAVSASLLGQVQGSAPRVSQQANVIVQDSAPQVSQQANVIVQDSAPQVSQQANVIVQAVTQGTAPL